LVYETLLNVEYRVDVEESDRGDARPPAPGESSCRSPVGLLQATPGQWLYAIESHCQARTRRRSRAQKWV